MMTIKKPAAGWNVQRATTSPGEMLMEEFLKPLGISQNRLALGIRVPSNRISQIIRGARSISPDTALRFARYFGNSPEFWLNLQQTYDLTTARQESAEKINAEVQPLKKTA